MEKEEAVFLRQLIKSLEESEKKLGDSYNKKDLEEFNKIKNFMMRLQGQIKGVIGK